MLKPKRTIDEPNMNWGVCLWQLPNGKYIEDDSGNYLVCGPAALNNPIVEKKMLAAARSCGVTEGRPFWLPGFRKVSDMEWDDQMERLLEGKIPDLADLGRQASMNGSS